MTNYDVDQRIRRDLERMSLRKEVSLSQVQRNVFGDMSSGGPHFRRIQEIWIEMNTNRRENWEPVRGARHDVFGPLFPLLKVLRLTLKAAYRNIFG